MPASETLDSLPAHQEVDMSDMETFVDHDTSDDGIVMMKRSASDAESAGLLYSDENGFDDDYRFRDEYGNEHYGKMRSDSTSAYCPCFNGIQCLGWTMLGVLIIGMFAVFLPEAPTNGSSIVQYTCPDHIGKSLSAGKDFDPIYEEQAKKEHTEDIEIFANSFRDIEFDDWGFTYTEVKKAMYDFKAKYFTPHLKSGDSIYESACGIGLNLLMTLEVLYEVANITDLVVYGNEYLEVSTKAANQVFDNFQTDYKAKKGKLCIGDSVDLAYVPSNSFDLVYCGYVSALADPLQFDEELNAIYAQYYSPICAANDTDWRSVKLRDMAQKIQNDWFGKWVAEMVRIAKPGVPVIVEQVAPEFCGHEFDWGGVRKEFWSLAIEEYQWDIDPDSIEFQNDTLFEDRYHVFMMKNAKSQDEVPTSQPSPDDD